MESVTLGETVWRPCVRDVTEAGSRVRTCGWGEQAQPGALLEA